MRHHTHPVSFRAYFSQVVLVFRAYFNVHFLGPVIQNFACLKQKHLGPALLLLTEELRKTGGSRSARTLQLISSSLYSWPTKILIIINGNRSESAQRSKFVELNERDRSGITEVQLLRTYAEISRSLDRKGRPFRGPQRSLLGLLVGLPYEGEGWLPPFSGEASHRFQTK